MADKSYYKNDFVIIIVVITIVMIKVIIKWINKTDKSSFNKSSIVEVVVTSIYHVI